VSFLHAFPDAASMDLHFEGADERVAEAYKHIQPGSWELYGKPSDAALETLRHAAASADVSLTVLPEHLGGFLGVQPG
jgi:hypothetical protein